MLTALCLLDLLAHQGAPASMGELLSVWRFDPLLVAVLVGLSLMYFRGRRAATDSRARQVSFTLALSAVAVALLSPVDAAASRLASAHMVQHVLLVLVAAPLLALSAPGAALSRGLPAFVRRETPGLRRVLHLDASVMRRLRSPVARWLLYVGTLWLWHAAALYGAAVEHAPVHVLEHLMFLFTALLVWSVILGPARVRVARGAGLMLVFGLALQTVFLSALLTFATSPWYEAYTTSAPALGMDAMADQQLAGVIMWIPAGLAHVVIAVALLASWIAESERDVAPDAIDATAAATAS